MAIQVPKYTMAPQTASLPALNPFTIDYVRVLGPARLLLRQRFGNEMKNLLSALPQPLDAVARIGWATDLGARPRNEDSAVAVMAHFGASQSAIPVILVGVADGLGGATDGHIASAIAVQVLTECVVNRLAAFGAGLSGTELSASSVEGLLMEAVSIAHYQMKAGTSGGSSTLTCALILDRAAYIAHIGDCRAYLLNTEWKDMELITRDHRRERQWQEMNIATHQQFTPHPRGHVLTRSLGTNEPCDVDLTRRLLVNGSRLLLCSNGIWEFVSSEAIYAAVHQSDQPQDNCERLVNAALANGAHDDMTAVLVQMPG